MRYSGMFKVLLLAAGVFSGLVEAQSMGPEEARHLLNRTGFDAQLREVDEFAKLSRRDAVERLLGGRAHRSAHARAGLGRKSGPTRAAAAMGEEERRAFVREQIEHGAGARAGG